MSLAQRSCLGRTKVGIAGCFEEHADNFGLGGTSLD